MARLLIWLDFLESGAVDLASSLAVNCLLFQSAADAAVIAIVVVVAVETLFGLVVVKTMGFVNIVAVVVIVPDAVAAVGSFAIKRLSPAEWH